MEIFSNSPSLVQLHQSVIAGNHENVVQITKFFAESIKQAKGNSDLLPCHTEAVVILASVLENIHNFSAGRNVICILHHLLCPKSTRKVWIVMLVSTSIVQSLLMFIIRHKEVLIAENVLIYQLHTTLERLSKKDNKLCVKARLSGAANVTASLMKLPSLKVRAKCALLSILKVYLHSCVTSSQLGKAGLVTTLADLLTNAQDITKTNKKLVTLIIETIAVITKLKANVKRLVRCGGVVRIVINQLETWCKSEDKSGKRITQASLNVLMHLCEIKSGRKSILEHDGIKKLYKVACAQPYGLKYDKLILTIFNIVAKCCGKVNFPLPKHSAVSFDISHISPSSNDVPSKSAGSDNDDDVSDDENGTSGESEDVNDGESISQLLQGSSLNDEMNADDVAKYKEFFQEQPWCHNQSKSFGPYCHTDDRHDDDETPESFIEDVIAADICSSATSVVDDNASDADYRILYETYSSDTRSALPFVKLAYPDLVAACSVDEFERLNEKAADMFRERIIDQLDQLLELKPQNGTVVYDLDALLKNTSIIKKLSNNDESRVEKENERDGNLQFESRFECGNLRKAIKVDDRVYDLFINYDVNIGSRHQWFYFEVCNMEAGLPYTFNIHNGEKTYSQFNTGMQPLMFSVKDFKSDKRGWRRVGSRICYHKNKFMKQTTTFTVEFPHSHDVCYFAFHFPYPYTRLLVQLHLWHNIANANGDIYFKKQKLCDSLNKNPLWLLTVTDNTHYDPPMQERKYIFLSARVHPGESNSSWVMKGSIDFLLSDDPIAVTLRRNFIFKIIPMLNPDGVINGNNRCSLLGVDLNRCWTQPTPSLHPEIFHPKMLFEYMQMYVRRSPFMFCDYHGHSGNKNIFLYGCSPSKSWFSLDSQQKDQFYAETFANICDKEAEPFSIAGCDFVIEKSKESTARVTVWRKYSCIFSYTLESSYCGCNQGAYKGLQMSTRMLEEMGCKFCGAIIKLLPFPTMITDFASQIRDHRKRTTSATYSSSETETSDSEEDDNVASSTATDRIV